MYFGKHFKSVAIHSKTFTSSLIAVDDERIWMHAVREDDKTQPIPDPQKSSKKKAKVQETDSVVK